MLAADGIDLISSSLKTLPYLVFLILWHWANLFPLLMELLEFLECLGHGFFVHQFLSLLAKHDLGIEIFLHIKVTQLTVDVDFVEELLHQEMVGVPKVGVLGSGHLADGLPFILKHAEVVVSLLQGFL